MKNFETLTGSERVRIHGLFEAWAEEHPRASHKTRQAEQQRLVEMFCQKRTPPDFVAQINAAISKEEIGKGPHNTYQSGLVDGLKKALAYIEEGKG